MNPQAQGAAATGAGTPGRPTTELVVVTYRSRARLAELLAGLPADLPVVVVDNSDTDDGSEELVSARPGGRYLRGGGVGYARAANAGARASQADVLVFANPDLRPSGEQVRQLVDDVASDPGTASSAALLVDADGRAEIGAGGWEPSPLRGLVHAAGLHKLLPRSGLYATPRVGEPLAVDWTCGGLMAVRREVFWRLGGFAEEFYVYGEDVAFGAAVRAAGLRQRLRTDVAVRGSSGGSGAPSLEMLRLRGASFRHYALTRSGAVRGALTTAVVAAGYAGRALAHLAARDRAEAAVDAAWVRGALTGRATVAGRAVMAPGRGSLVGGS
ncbi:glycosyltransferase [Quadrisphaera sp. KR29]|uniref:glycosyltransferase n=1 Tax=Quadrisphaera sp. KR29 TaxID=3461391 RepID=UPI00404420EE